MIMKKTRTGSGILALLLAGSLAYADLDWGGGVTQFQTTAGVPLAGAEGLAVLVSVRSGSLVDAASACPLNPAALVTPGAVIADHNGENIVLATANSFLDGYLLLTSIPDLENALQQAWGAAPGQRLFLVVWETATLLAGVPVDGSRFVACQLFVRGQTSAPGMTFGAAPPYMATMVYPDLSRDTAPCGTVRGTQEQTFTLTLDPGWNLISVPFLLPNPSLSAVFGTLPVVVLGWAPGGYAVPAVIEPKKGYWLHYGGVVAVDLNLRGHLPVDQTIALQAGWNLIGPVAAVALPVGCGSSYWWEPQTRTYRRDDVTLQTGRGYWIYSASRQDFP